MKTLMKSALASLVIGYGSFSLANSEILFEEGMPFSTYLEEKSAELKSLIEESKFEEAHRKSLAILSDQKRNIERYITKPDLADLVVPSLFLELDDWRPDEPFSDQTEVIKQKVRLSSRERLQDRKVESVIWYKHFKFLYATSILSSVLKNGTKLNNFYYDQLKSTIQDAVALPLVVRFSPDSRIHRIVFVEELINPDQLFQVTSSLEAFWSSLVKNYENNNSTTPQTFQDVIQEARLVHLKRANTATNRATRAQLKTADVSLLDGPKGRVGTWKEDKRYSWHVIDFFYYTESDFFRSYDRSRDFEFAQRRYYRITNREDFNHSRDFTQMQLLSRKCYYRNVLMDGHGSRPSLDPYIKILVVKDPDDDKPLPLEPMFVRLSDTDLVTRFKTDEATSTCYLDESFDPTTGDLL